MILICRRPGQAETVCLHNLPMQHSLAKQCLGVRESKPGSPRAMMGPRCLVSFSKCAPIPAFESLVPEGLRSLFQTICTAPFNALPTWLGKAAVAQPVHCLFYAQGRYTSNNAKMNETQRKWCSVSFWRFSINSKNTRLRIANFLVSIFWRLRFRS